MCSADEFASECIKLVGKYKFIQGCRKHAILKGLISIPFVDYITRIIDKKVSKDKKLNWNIKNNNNIKLINYLNYLIILIFII